MSNVVDINADEERLDISSRWIVRMERGLLDSEEVALRTWMAADRKNADMLLSMAKNWDKMDDLSRLADLFPESRAAPTRLSRLKWAAAALTLVMAVTMTVLLMPESSVDGINKPLIVDTLTTPQTYETAIGGQSTVTLADGTIVVLNTNSRIQVAYSDHARVLHLERGEIHVDVANIAQRPFSVMAEDRIMQAVGTSFSVEITVDKRIELVVTEGRVVIGVHPHPLAVVGQTTPPPILAQSPDNTVAAGEEIVLGGQMEKVTEVSAEEIEVKLSWRQGRLVFRGEPLEAALAEVARYTTVQFVFLDEELKTRSVTGRFRAGDVEGLLMALRVNFNIAYERSADGRVVLSSL